MCADQTDKHLLANHLDARRPGFLHFLLGLSGIRWL
jgi:hypothetical protein